MGRTVKSGTVVGVVAGFDFAETTLAEGFFDMVSCDTPFRGEDRRNDR